MNQKTIMIIMAAGLVIGAAVRICAAVAATGDGVGKDDEG